MAIKELPQAVLNVMATKEYCQALLAVIEYVNDGHSEITCEKGFELAGDYWPRIFRLFKGDQIGTGLSNGDFHITQQQYLAPMRADCRCAIKEIEMWEADRGLDNATKEANIKYAQRAFYTSLVALFIAALSLVWQILT